MGRKTSAPAEGPPTPSSTGSSRESRSSERVGDADANSGSFGGPGTGSEVVEGEGGNGRGRGPVVLRRRGHFKSRLGCLNCKRRRVKCNELRPECGPCRRLGLACEYSSATTMAASMGEPKPTISMLALEDLKFYHQFLTVAYPTLPLRASEVWSQCAAMSHQYEYLAHAVLGLGASHLSQNRGGDFSSQAIQHRVAAINLVNQQFDNPSKVPADADALFATVVCLCAQSSLMPDSMAEYMTMVRGGNIVATTIIPDYQKSVFRAFTPEGHIQTLSAIVEEQPKDLDVCDGFAASVLDLEPLCQKPHELQYRATMLSTIDALRTSSIAAWKAFVNVYMFPSVLSNEEFTSLIDPENNVGQLLIIHMFLLDYICGRFCIAKADEPKFGGRKNIVITWTRNVANSLPAEYQKYAEWPLQYCDELASLDSRYLLSP